MSWTMQKTVRMSLLAGGGSAGLLSAPGAEATLFEFSRDDLSGLSAPIEGNGAAVRDVTTTYDDVTQRFTWDVTFTPGPGGAQATGYSLVVNDGPEPKGREGNLAVLYFDAETDPAAPIVTAYAYNGADSATSFRYSNFENTAADGNDTPDAIVSSLNDAFVETASVTDHADGTRTFRLALDASGINAHDPLLTPTDRMNGDAPLTWRGLEFANRIGVWFHPYHNIEPVYDDAGFIFADTDAFSALGWRVGGNYGFLDAADLEARVVPEPAGLALLSFGGLTLLRRRGR